MSDSDVNQILVVEDTIPLAQLYGEYLRSEGYRVHFSETAGHALAAVAARPPDAVVLDLKLPDRDGLDVLRILRQRHPDLPVVVITAHGSVSVAVEAMREGAFDFLLKPFSATRLNVTVRNALERRDLTRIVERYRRELDRDGFHDFIGVSPPMQTLYRLIESVAPSRANVFLTGESGTGKELAAEAIHRASPRRDRPFIAINCAAIPRDLLESEIFGHVRGAFTGALHDRSGAARQADGGTLFLDEVCEMPLELQAKLLRFVQTGTFQAVGSSQTERVDLRFISATNRDPQAEVDAGRFREDLFYRLHVVPIDLPPLRDRGDDVILIARRLVADMAREEGKDFTGLTAGAEAALRSHPWPGNVRQLQNVLRQAVVMHDGPRLGADMLPPTFRNPAPVPTPPAARIVPPAAPPTGSVPENDSTFPAAHPDIRPLWQIERDAIRAALERTGDDVARAAALLEISPSTVYRKIQQWRLRPPSGD